MYPTSWSSTTCAAHRSGARAAQRARIACAASRTISLPSTQRRNVLRGNGVAAINARKQTCPDGYPYDGFAQGRRRCSHCARKRARATYWRKKARKTQEGDVA